MCWNKIQIKEESKAASSPGTVYKGVIGPIVIAAFCHVATAGTLTAFVRVHTINNVQGSMSNGQAGSAAAGRRGIDIAPIPRTEPSSHVALSL